MKAGETVKAKWRKVLDGMLPTIEMHQVMQRLTHLQVLILGLTMSSIPVTRYALKAKV